MAPREFVSVRSNSGQHWMNSVLTGLSFCFPSRLCSVVSVVKYIPLEDFLSVLVSKRRMEIHALTKQSQIKVHSQAWRAEFCTFLSPCFFKSLYSFCMLMYVLFIFHMLPFKITLVLYIFTLLASCGQQWKNFIVWRNMFPCCAYDSKRCESWLLHMV